MKQFETTSIIWLGGWGNIEFEDIQLPSEPESLCHQLLDMLSLAGYSMPVNIIVFISKMWIKIMSNYYDCLNKVMDIKELCKRTLLELVNGFPKTSVKYV